VLHVYIVVVPAQTCLTTSEGHNTFVRPSCVLSRESSHLLQEAGLDITHHDVRRRHHNTTHHINPKSKPTPFTQRHPTTIGTVQQTQLGNTFRPWDTSILLQSTWRRRQSQQLERRRISLHSICSNRNETSATGTQTFYGVREIDWKNQRKHELLLKHSDKYN
jgi:hypothetical protein